jgi:2-keto-4-pentenoate hydratase/2-oxohepta-3-ene-1,7-dioic acid hydratase in catechol pathway
MRLIRIGAAGAERPAVLTADGLILDASGVVRDYDTAYWESGVAALHAAVEAGALPEVPAADRFGPPIVRPGKVVCIGLNYRDHAEETNAAVPTEPVIFMKAPDCVVGPDDEVLVPRGSVKTDYEVELGVVIGRTARYVESDAEALACVGGYVISHDVSEREFQLERTGTWDKGKSCETFNPVGPHLVTADEIDDPQDLGLRLWVNGELRQDSSTANMIFGVAELVRTVSQYMVLRPGDLVNTGTPAGVALGQPDPKPYLRAGDVVELEIDRLGRQRQTLGQA